LAVGDWLLALAIGFLLTVLNLGAASNAIFIPNPTANSK
jgi:hypothetical protein